MATALSEEQLNDLLQAHPRWQVEDGKLTRRFKFPSFPDAIAFITVLAFEAERVQHHPDLENTHANLTVRFFTHDDQALTEKDAEMVKWVDEHAASLLPS